MYGHIRNKIDLKTPKKPLNPYGVAKKKSFNLVKKYRELYGMSNYNAIMFNTDSILRNRDFLISKICIGAIKAFRNKKKLTVNNIIVSREWNWCEEQCKLLFKFLSKKPQDFILSNGKSYTIRQMLIFAYQYFNLDFKKFVNVKFKKLKKDEVKEKRSNYRKYFRKNKINFKSKIFGKKLIFKMIYSQDISKKLIFHVRIILMSITFRRQFNVFEILYGLKRSVAKQSAYSGRVFVF